MLELRRTDISTSFFVFIVLPLVTYVLLGKWSEASRRKERINLIAKQAAEEALRVEDMAVGSVIPLSSVPNGGRHLCGRCSGPATTRCSQCKSVWYCSGNCQIIHWRQVHKFECHQLANKCHVLSPKCISLEDSQASISYDETIDPNPLEYNVKEPSLEKINVSMNGNSDQKSTLHENNMVERQLSNAFSNVCSNGILNSKATTIGDVNACDIQMDLTSGEHLSQKGNGGKTRMSSLENGNKARNTLLPCRDEPQKSKKSGVKRSKNSTDKSSVVRVNDNILFPESSRIANLGMMSMIGVTKSMKNDHERHSEDCVRKEKKMLFPYEEFVKFFQFEVLNVSPKGLVNCGNSCYANAVLQCLTWTKPLIIYHHRRSHSRAGCAKNWCLMCELERHVMTLSGSGHPLSAWNILMHIRSLNSQIGTGSQEDAHEILRLIVASMQSICLERLGGENVVDPILQETTFIQHTFGGRLRSKVKCLRCHQESERYENIMDLTLEIFGWVESLEDALTQFTSSEDLDGDNLYRCGRCASYVRARKELRIQEAPNILTIVLKRFREGNYGKINKCVTFPEMLDMIPFMTGTDDIPPLYTLYAVVVHLDTSNASFSGHYISYVRDLQGNWFKIDDTEVQPVELSQVMSEGAYILFYARSHPRRKKDPPNQSSIYPKKSRSKTEKSSKSDDNFIRRDTGLGNNPRKNLLRQIRSIPPIPKNYTEFSDAASCNSPLFTSSDDSSFTTESTSDSFSTADYVDTVPFSSVFQSLYPADSVSRRTISCSMFPDSIPEAGYVHEEKGFVSVSFVQNLTSQDCGVDPERSDAVLRSTGLLDDYSYGVNLNYDDDSINGPAQTYI
ncbi:ubiquitin carboxyl-terminal hydrolase 15-like isoform X2 [Primulina tabacum]|uniref:ubiquitin carboxyl-terminal hydrolase 15-like isoform X2 n=1 Tax=Primulina tabacum TaxID=48773 RepID=UPI003F5967F9